MPATRPAPKVSSNGVEYPPGGNGKTLSANPEVTAGAYSANDQVGGLLTFTNAALVAGGGLVVTDVCFVDDAGQDSELELWLFSVEPSDAGDNAAFAPGEAALEGSHAVYSTADGTWRAAGTPSSCVVQGIQRLDCATGSTTIYGLLVTRGTPTFVATDDVTVHVGCLQD